MWRKELVTKSHLTLFTKGEISHYYEFILMQIISILLYVSVSTCEEIYDYNM